MLRTRISIIHASIEPVLHFPRLLLICWKKTFLILPVRTLPKRAVEWSPNQDSNLYLNLFSSASKTRASVQASSPGCARLAGRADPRYSVGMRCYALHLGPRRNKDSRWVPAIVTKVTGNVFCTNQSFYRWTNLAQTCRTTSPVFSRGRRAWPHSRPPAVTEGKSNVPNNLQRSSSGAEETENGVISSEEERNQRPGWLAKRKRPNPRLPKENEDRPSRPRPSERLRKRLDE